MLNYIETHIVDHCNLKCRGCSHFSCISEPYFYTLEEYKKSFYQLYSIESEIKTIRVMGGEPLLHPNCFDFLRFTRELYPNSTIVLVSNGIKLKDLSDEWINDFNQLNLKICISDYKIKIDREKLLKFNSYEFHDKAQLYNISLNLDGDENYIKSFNDCDIVHWGCNYLKGNRIFQCSIFANIDTFSKYFDKKINYDIDDISIDITTHTAREVEEFLKRPKKTCRYCRSIDRDSTLADFATTKGDIKEWTI